MVVVHEIPKDWEVVCIRKIPDASSSPSSSSGAQVAGMRGVKTAIPPIQEETIEMSPHENNVVVENVLDEKPNFLKLESDFEEEEEESKSEEQEDVPETGVGNQEEHEGPLLPPLPEILIEDPEKKAAMENKKDEEKEKMKEEMERMRVNMTKLKEDKLEVERERTGLIMVLFVLILLVAMLDSRVDKVKEIVKTQQQQQQTSSSSEMTIPTVFLYEGKNHTGGKWHVGEETFREIPCQNLNLSNDKISSIDTQGVCVVVYENPDCKGRMAVIAKETPSHFDLHYYSMDKTISSLSLCPK